ncbi:MAG: efflux transporter outer membrane subunit [Betaproteobacteria bacterium]
MRRAVLAWVLVSGCTRLGPDYARPQVELPNEYVTQPVSAAAALPSEWWRLYADRTLDQLVADVHANNADLRIAAAQVREAEAVLRQVGAARFPEVSLAATRSSTRVSELTSPPPAITASLTRPDTRVAAATTFELDFWGRLERASEAARAGLLGSRYGREVVALSLASLTAQAYFSLRSLDAQLAVLAETIRARRESVDLARARLEAGLSSELDLHQAQAALSDALVQRREAQRQRALVERQLGQLSGRAALALPAGDVFSIPLPPTPPAGLPSALLERRPDIRAAEQTLVAANAQIGVARAALFPSVSLTAALGVQSAQVTDLLASGSNIWTLGFAAALPIFDGGRRQAVVEQAEARRTAALAGYQKAIEAGFREVSDALVSLRQASEAESDLADRVKAARNALALSTQRYEAGYSPYLEVLDAQRTANDAELAFVRNRQARLAFSVELMKALGGGWKN